MVRMLKKFKNFMLKATTAVSAVLFMISVCALDSESIMPAIIAFISLGWLFLVVAANRERFEADEWE